MDRIRLETSRSVPRPLELDCILAKGINGIMLRLMSFVVLIGIVGCGLIYVRLAGNRRSDRGADKLRRFIV